MNFSSPAKQGDSLFCCPRCGAFYDDPGTCSGAEGTHDGPHHPQVLVRVFSTPGEQLAGRELRKEKRAGLTHFVTGQHRATIEVRDGVDHFDSSIVGDVGRLTYVDVWGRLVCVLTWRDKGSEEWRATWVSTAGQETKSEAVRAPEDIVLSEKMLAALKEADGRA